jgi:hypothetical protein
LDDLLEIARINWERQKYMPISRDDLKKKRLQAMGVVGTQMDASATMYDEITEYSKKVEEARAEAKAAHLGAMNAEIADLKEMADELAEFAQAVPSNGGSGGNTSSTATKTPAATTVTPSNASAALAALQAAVPNPKPETWTVGEFSDRNDH